MIIVLFTSSSSINTKVNDISFHDLKSENNIIKINHELANLSFSINKDYSIKIENTNNDNLFAIIFGNCGINSLYGIKEISYSEFEIDNKPKELKLQSCTDWVGPYIVKDKTEDYNQNKPQFTGGWHGTNGDETGDPSACTSQVKIYYDDKLTSELKEGWCNELKIEVTNIINGYNTLKPVIEEVITYTINNRTIKVNVMGKALSEIEIEKYYGLQSQNSLWNGSIEYVYTDGSMDKFPINFTSSSVIKRNKIVKDYILSSADSTFKLQVGINSTIGIGNYEYLSSQKPTCFTLDYGKTYFNLVNGKRLLLQKNEIFVWEGYYNFID